MINILNRKELIVTYDSKLYSRVLDVLDNNEIEYTVKLRNTGTGNVSKRSGALAGYNERTRFETEYKIFVHKKELEKVKYLVRKCYWKL